MGGGWLVLQSVLAREKLFISIGIVFIIQLRHGRNVGKIFRGYSFSIPGIVLREGEGKDNKNFHECT